MPYRAMPLSLCANNLEELINVCMETTPNYLCSERKINKTVTWQLPTSSKWKKKIHSPCLSMPRLKAVRDCWNYLETPRPSTATAPPLIGCPVAPGPTLSSEKFLFLLWRCFRPWASLKNKYIKLSLIKSQTTWSWVKIIAINMTKG